MSRRIIGYRSVGEYMREPVYAMDGHASVEPERDDGADLHEALDAAEEALQGLRDGSIDPTRAAIAFERCAIGLQRHGADSAIGELPARSVLKLERARQVDHRRDWNSINSAQPPQDMDASDELSAELRDILPAGRSARAPVRTAPVAMDEQLRRNREISRKLSERTRERQRNASLDELVGLV